MGCEEAVVGVRQLEAASVVICRLRAHEVTLGSFGWMGKLSAVAYIKPGCGRGPELAPELAWAWAGWLLLSMIPISEHVIARYVD